MEQDYSSSLEYSWAAWLINKPITVLMMFISILVTGAISFQKIPLQMLPSGFDPPYLSIRVPYDNANPADVERQITRPIEDMIGTIPGILETKSSSSANGTRVRIKFSNSVSMPDAYAQLQDRMERLRPEFPEDVRRYTIRKFNFNDFPIFFIGVYAQTEESNQETALEEWIENAERLKRIFIPRLEQEAGIAQVELFGTYAKKIAIYLDRSKVQSHNVNVGKLLSRLRATNTDSTGGIVEQQGHNFTIRSLGKFNKLSEIQNYPVNETIKLKDISSFIGYSKSLDSFRVRINGKPAVFVEVYKESAANTVDICRRVNQLMEQLQKQDQRFSKYSFSILHDEGQLIRESLFTLGETLFWGALFAVMILFFFLRKVNMTALITLSIPFSLFMSLIVVHFNGSTLNLLSLMGFTLAVGMLLDNAVVVVENIYRYIEKGLSPREAAVVGVGEVGLAIFLATSTTLVVFLPLMVMNPDASFKFFMSEMGGAVCFSLIASLFAALVFIPTVVVYVEQYKSNKAPKETPAWSLYCENLIDKSLLLYRKSLTWILSHRFETICFILLPLFFSTYLIHQSLGRTDQGSGVERSLRIRISYQDVKDVYKNSDAMYKLEQVILANKERLEVKNILAHCNDDRGRIRIWLTDLDQAIRSTPEITKELESLLPELPGIEIKGSWDKGRGSGGEGGDVPIVIRGEDPQTLRELGEKIQDLLVGMPGVVEVTPEEEDQVEEIILYLNRELTQKYKVSPRETAQVISGALRGSRISDFQEKDHEIEITMQFSSQGLESLDKLKDLRIFNLEEESLPLHNIAHAEIRKGADAIQKTDRKISYTLNVVTEEEDLQKFGAAIDERLASVSLPRGYTINKEGRFADMESSEADFMFAFLLGVTFVFLLMGFLFESLLLPFSIILSIPFAFIGVYWILYLTNTAMGMMSFLGCLVLAGVVVNNGIVLVDYINRLRNEGMERNEAILEAGHARFRPILMTSLTTLIGLLPMALGNSDFVGTPYFPLGRTVIGGLGMSTLLTLLIVPVFYTFFDDLRDIFWRVAASVFRS